MADAGEMRSRGEITDNGSRMFDRLEEKVPEKYKDIAEKVRPIVMGILAIADIIYPMLPLVYSKAKALYEASLPYKHHYCVVWGLVLTFFGGSFFMTLTTIEAFKLVGRERFERAWKKIDDDVQRVVAGAKEINEKKMTTDDWLKANGAMVLQNINPDDFRDALTGFYAGATAVIAALRNQYAQIIALGASLGEVIEERFGAAHVMPLVKALIPEEHWKWAPFVVQTVCRFPMVFAAWCLQRVVVAVHSAMKGGNQVASHLLHHLAESGMIKECSNDMITTLSFIIAGCGVLFQLSYAFSLPWWLAIFLFPLTFVEWLLGFVAFSFTPPGMP
eukprot:TRINITY_DN27611_c0_g1_i1.p1 TRINITY_DN27611_c0_g1~~TRINITY_DN27611_c0_g1_i1.p1  ORF type:complete len:332 (+),score=158.31 TRINITY_DN27611_c0_g1_i1:59-1054(+)